MVVVAVAVTAGVVRSRTRSEATASGAGSALAGVTWTDPASGGTVVFTATTARVSDGCAGALHELSIAAHTLEVGKPIGAGFTCGGTPRPQAGPLRVAYDRHQAAVTEFDRILSGRATWSRSGASLHLASAAGTLVLRASGAAVTVAGETWTLDQAADPVSIRGPFTGATLTISRGGKVTATDLCNTLSGTATITTTTIDFGNLVRTQRACPAANPKVSATIDAVLSGRITYSIFNDKLNLVGRGRGVLVYRLAP